MTKRTLLFCAAGLLCLVTGVPVAGAAFAAAAAFVSLPKLPPCGWYVVVLGALAADICAMLTGESPAVFWTLLLTAGVALSLVSLPRCVILFAAAWLMLRLNVAPEIYAAAFISVILNSILRFTYQKSCDIISI